MLMMIKKFQKNSIQQQLKSLMSIYNNITATTHYNQCKIQLPLDTNTTVAFDVCSINPNSNAGGISLFIEISGLTSNYF